MWPAIRLTNCAAESRSCARAVTKGTRAAAPTNQEPECWSRVRSGPIRTAGTTDPSRGATLIFGGHLAEKEDRVSCNVDMYCYVHVAWS